MNNLKNQLCDSFFLFPANAGEIESEISYLNYSKATRPFSIPSNIFKLLSVIVSKPLETLFNASFSTDIVPAA